MSTSPNKRQRLAGSFSPASPPYHLAKASEQRKPPVVHPNTPTSPPYMSSTSQANGYSAFSGTAQSSEMTPPSSVVMSQQFSQQPGTTANHAFPTPASSTAGTVSFALKDSDGDAQMMDESTEDVAKTGDDGAAMSGTDEHRRSDHDRQEKGSLASESAGHRRRNADGGCLFKLCVNPHSISRPHTSQNLIELYGLNSIAASVARKDPVTGEKINKLRKSYEGQIKKLQIAGKNKAISNPDELMNFMGWPEQEWQNQKVYGKSVMDGLSGDVLGLLDRALQMAPGGLPPDQAEKWRNLVATDDGVKSKAGVDVPGKKPLQSTPNTRSPATLSPAVKAVRPERAGTKRRYNDTSFVGYGEGFADDDVADSTGGEDDGRSGFKNKKRRK
ncbi:Rox3-domain-containing protein, partial [Lepidopterella palustris CBS 459.81]